VLAIASVLVAMMLLLGGIGRLMHPTLSV